MIVDKSPTPEAAKPTESAVSPIYDVSPAPVFLVQRGSEVSFFIETGFDFGYMLKMVIVSGLKWRVEAHRNLFTRWNVSLKWTTGVHNDRGLIRSDIMGRKSKPFKSNFWTNNNLAHIQEAILSLVLNDFECEPHLRCLL